MAQAPYIITALQKGFLISKGNKKSEFFTNKEGDIIATQHAELFLKLMSQEVISKPSGKKISKEVKT